MREIGDLEHQRRCGKVQTTFCGDTTTQGSITYVFEIDSCFSKHQEGGCATAEERPVVNLDFFGGHGHNLLTVVVSKVLERAKVVNSGLMSVTLAGVFFKAVGQSRPPAHHHSVVSPRVNSHTVGCTGYAGRRVCVNIRTTNKRLCVDCYHDWWWRGVGAESAASSIRQQQHLPRGPRTCRRGVFLKPRASVVSCMYVSVCVVLRCCVALCCVEWLWLCCVTPPSNERIHRGRPTNTISISTYRLLGIQFATIPGKPHFVTLKTSLVHLKTRIIVDVQ